MNRRTIGHGMTIVCALIACASIAGAQQVTGGSAKKRPATGLEVQGFSVVLVLGDLDGTSTGADNVPVAARKALTDMKDFLPYKSYRLLDTVWILSGDTTNTSSRLRGPEVSVPGSPGAGIWREYELVLSASPVPAGSTANGRLLIAFQLRDPSASAQMFTRVRETAAGARATSSTPSIDHMRAELNQRAESARLEAGVARERAELERLRAQLEQKPETPQDQTRQRVVERQAVLERLVRELAVARGIAAGTLVAIAKDLPRTVIDTGFSMNIGETVVVGTSRVQGDKAIIVLLTAVPRGGR